ncbi:MAG: beta-glucosidase [Chitinophagaceae bacterium]|nr:MAG: beta-glucosidase [Chitinophagaceae bacterium]
MYKKDWIDLNKNGVKDIYEDAQQPVEKRIADLLAQMSVEEKSNQLATVYGYGAVLKSRLPEPFWKDSIWKDGLANIDEQLTGLRADTVFAYPYAQHTTALNIIQRWFIEETRLGIPIDFTGEGIRGLNHMIATYFPSQLAQASTFNAALVRKIGEVTGREARALGYTNIYSPILDVATDPRWGRIEETYGSSPYLVARLGTENALGIQSQKVAATAKHYAVYSIPFGGSDGYVRTHPMVSEREMYMKYLRPFEYVIKNAALMGVMVSYNDYDGEPIIVSKKFLTDYLRNKFGFKGYTVSDSHAFEDIMDKYHITDDINEAARLALSAGLNVRTNFSSPTPFIMAVRKGVEKGTISKALLDERVGEVLSVKFRLGLFDHPYVLDKNATNIVHNQEAQHLALEAAHQSIVLLKNDKSLLPLDKSKYGTIAIIGPNAKEQKSMLSRYGPLHIKVETIYDAIQKEFLESKILYAKGTNHTDAKFPQSDIEEFSMNSAEEKMMNEAIEIAKQSDIVILSVGDNASTVGESASRLSLELPGYQNQLIDKIAALGKPMVLIHTGGRPASFVKATKTVDAIIENFYAGEMGAKAVAQVLSGQYNPSGKLPLGILKHVGQTPLAFPMMLADGAKGNAAVTGFLYPFGHGLSYAKFEYSDLKINATEFSTSGKIDIKCKIKNTSNLKGDEVVQLYFRDELASLTVYQKELCGFERISLAPGESKEIQFTIDKKTISLINQQLETVFEPGDFTFYLGSSSEDIRLKSTIHLK